jgi:hypothetical protein
MKKACPSDTWPATPVRMFRPSAAMAKMNTSSIGRSQLESPRKRRNGMPSPRIGMLRSTGRSVGPVRIGTSNGSRNRIRIPIAAIVFLVHVGRIWISCSYEL